MNYLLIAALTTYLYLAVKIIPTAWKVIVKLNDRGYFPPAPVKNIQWMSYFFPFLIFMFFYMVIGIFVDFMIRLMTLNLFGPAHTDEELGVVVDKIMERKK